MRISDSTKTDSNVGIVNDTLIRERESNRSS